MLFMRPLIGIIKTALTLNGTLLNRIVTAQWEGMGDVESARYEPALLPPCPTIRVLRYSKLPVIHPLDF